MFSPAPYTESEALVGFLDQQLDAIRTAAHGLTEEQARATPCRSALSIGGLLKHTTWVLRSRAREAADPTAVPDEAGLRAFQDSFALREDESLAGALEAFDAARADYLRDARAADPGGLWVAPPAPWAGRPQPVDSVQRYALLHHVQEFARHAGHADLLREQLDGATALPLLMAVQGLPGNAFVQPWSPSA